MGAQVSVRYPFDLFAEFGVVPADSFLVIRIRFENLFEDGEHLIGVLGLGRHCHEIYAHHAGDNVLIFTSKPADVETSGTPSKGNRGNQRVVELRV